MAGPLDTSFRRSVRGGVEQQEFSDLSSFLNSVVLSTSNDRWYFSLSSSGEFSVKDTRLAIDDLVLPSHSEPTRWVKLIPIKINVFMWRARRGCLPTRYNLVQKGVILESTSCPVCFSDEEDVHHLLFRCSLSQEVLHRVCRWWEIDFQLWRSFSEWDEWFSSIRLPGSVKASSPPNRAPHPIPFFNHKLKKGNWDDIIVISSDDDDDEEEDISSPTVKSRIK
ncbi:RNA-directed DNA polymerase, eukaryota [Tanacetum coccineum]